MAKKKTKQVLRLPITRQEMHEQARSGKDASSTYLYVERIQQFLHIAVVIINITFHG